MQGYRLYVDESGDHYYHEIADTGERFLSLTGLIVEKEQYRTSFHPELEKLKQSITPHDPDNPIILHRREIMDCKGVFKVFQDKTVRQYFNDALLAFVEQQQYVIITIALDKTQHLQRYGAAAFHPYHYCLSLLLERYCGYLNLFRSKGDILAESRGKKEDQNLKDAYTELLSGGTQFRRGDFFKSVLLEDELKTAKKKHNISGLQLADLLAYPSKEDVLSEYGRIPAPTGYFRDKLRKAMRKKYNRQVYRGRIKGYGMILV